MENEDLFVLKEEHRLGEAAVIKDEDIPLVDLQEEHAKVVEEVKQACKRWGFFQVKNHGIPESLLEDMLKASHEFFGLPVEELERFENLSKALDGFRNSEGGDPGGVVTCSLKPDFPNLRYFLRVHRHLADRLDAWPKSPASLKGALASYNKHVHTLVYQLLEIISESLGLPKEQVVNYFGPDEAHRQILQLNYYPTHKDPSKVKGVNEHSDGSGITVLLQDNLGGLEVRNNDTWVAIKPIQNAFVINLGDQLQVLTNGRYKSAEHRVRVNSGQPRVSVATFYGPSLESNIAPIPELTKEGAEYRECITKDYLKNFFSRGLSGKTALDYVKVQV